MKLWAMYTPKGKLMWWTTKATRRDCIRAECWAWRPWDALRKEGYTVRKVKVVEVSE